MTKKEALTTLRQLLQELYSTHNDADRIAEEAGLNLASIAASDKLVNYWWNILVEAHKRGKVASLVKSAAFEWDERAAEIKAAFQTYESAADGSEPIEPIGTVATSSTTINTGGGAYIGGGVKVDGGDFVGRDKITHGDEVKGNKVVGDKITVGDISGSTGIAIGRGAQSNVNQGVASADLAAIFAPLAQAIQSAPADRRDEAAQKVQQLQAEAAKGDKADDRRMAKLIDSLAELVPGAVSTLVGIFATPLLSGLAGNATEFVLDKIQGK